MNKIFLVFFCALFSKTSYSQEKWVLVGEDVENNVHYINSKYISKGVSDNRPDIIKIWIKTIYLKKTIKNIPYLNVECMALEEFDCKQKQIKVDKIYYSNANGELLWSIDAKKIQEDSWDYPVPGHMPEIILEKLCSMFN